MDLMDLLRSLRGGGIAGEREGAGRSRRALVASGAPPSVLIW
jgi:hypothetical protein